MERYAESTEAHEIGPDEVAATALKYKLQAQVYERAARALAGEARVRLHFTSPNVQHGFE